MNIQELERAAAEHGAEITGATLAVVCRSCFHTWGVRVHDLADLETVDPWRFECMSCKNGAGEKDGHTTE